MDERARLDYAMAILRERKTVEMARPRRALLEDGRAEDIENPAKAAKVVSALLGKTIRGGGFTMFERVEGINATVMKVDGRRYIVAPGFIVSPSDAPLGTSTKIAIKALPRNVRFTLSAPKGDAVTLITGMVLEDDQVILVDGIGTCTLHWGDDGRSSSAALELRHGNQSEFALTLCNLLGNLRVLGGEPPERRSFAEVRALVQSRLVPAPTPPAPPCGKTLLARAEAGFAAEYAAAEKQADSGPTLSESMGYRRRS